MKCQPLSFPCLALGAVFVGFICPASLHAQASAPESDASPWGIATSASSFGEYPGWMPKMAQAGVRWARIFPEWGGFENPKGTFHFEQTDKMVAVAKVNHIEVSGSVFGKAPWTDTGAHAFPMEALEDWTNYAAAIAGHYKDSIRYWEVWNEGNAGFNDGHNTTTDYARLLAAAYAGVKKANPEAEVGIDVASYDPAYIDQVVLAQAKSGQPGSFDYICLHPYETTGALSEANGEIPFLWMSKMLRDALKVDAPAKADADIWITEIGRIIGSLKESKETDAVSEEVAAQTLVKVYTMSLAQGIKRICWFEAQDARNEPAGYGVLRQDGSVRPSYTALKAMTSIFGETPRPIGWLALGTGKEGYGFVFEGAKGPVLTAWMPLGKKDKSGTFTSDVSVMNPLKNSVETLHSGHHLSLSDSPVFITNLPENLVAQARANGTKNFPWGGDYSSANSVAIQLGIPDGDHGVIQVERNWTKPYQFHDGSTGARVSQPGRHDNQNIKFITHPSFANLKTHDYYIRVTARRITPPSSPASYCKLSLVYEVADSQGRGPMRLAGRDMSGADIASYKGEAKGEDFVLSKKTDQWETHTWHVTDAAFAKMWAYDFAFLIDKSDPFVIGKVEVSKQPFGNSP